jgi:hypothetical protein
VRRALIQEYPWSHPKDADPQVQGRDGLFQRVPSSRLLSAIRAHHSPPRTHTHTKNRVVVHTVVKDSRKPFALPFEIETKSHFCCTRPPTPPLCFLIRQFTSGVRHHVDQTRRDTEPRRPCPCSTRPSPWPPARYLLHTMQHTTHTTHHTIRHDTMMVDRFTQTNVFGKHSLWWRVCTATASFCFCSTRLSTLRRATPRSRASSLVPAAFR